jgi:hypothetical protein
MGTFLSHIETTPDPPKRIKISLDIGRTLALTVLGALAIGGAVALFLGGHTAAGNTLLGVGEAIIFGGLGIAYGERRGAREAGKQLTADMEEF